MDDNELEARLRTHLHRRFDSAPVPGGLEAAVRQAMAMAAPARLSFELQPRGLQLGWVATIAAVVVVGALLLVGRGVGPAAPSATATPSPIPGAAGRAERAFIVLPSGSAAVPKPDSDLAGDVFQARLGALGLRNFATVTGNAFAVYGPADGPSDGDIRVVLAATGDVEFVPLPPSVLGEVDPQTLVGEAVPNGATPLFGHDGIASARRGTSPTQGFPTVEIKLTSAASALFADYTTNHPQEYLAIVIDGKVALTPVINEPILGGEVSITGGGAAIPGRPDTTFDVAASILVGGRLPEGWRGAEVPLVLGRDQAMSAARIATGGHEQLTVEASDLQGLADGSRWRAVWVVTFSDDVTVTVDAVTGEWLSTGTP